MTGIGSIKITRSVKTLIAAPAMQLLWVFAQLPFCSKFQLKLTGLHIRKLATT